MPPQNDLGRLLARRIATDGPISVAEYMAQALGHPEFGYYMGQDPLGAAGDFITAPEISQMFGELIGLWCVNTWLALGKPAPFLLTELGPGRGTLMADALRALETVPACRAAARVHLIECSPTLRERQRQALSDIDVTWQEAVVDLPMAPVIFIANEFFDALPVEQFMRRGDGWHQRMVDYRPEQPGDEPRFVFAEGPAPCPVENISAYAEANAQVGDITEDSPATQQIAVEIARRVRSHTGAALIVDYGYAVPALGETLQAVRGHSFASVLEQPGEVDLTAHVDFSALAGAALSVGAASWGAITQSEFLRRLGIETRAGALAASATQRQKPDIESALQRLIGSDQMGTLFKVMAIGPRSADAPAGFLSEEANLG